MENVGIVSQNRPRPLLPQYFQFIIHYLSFQPLASGENISSGGHLSSWGKTTKSTWILSCSIQPSTRIPAVPDLGTSHQFLIWNTWRSATDSRLDQSSSRCGTRPTGGPQNRNNNCCSHTKSSFHSFPLFWKHLGNVTLVLTKLNTSSFYWACLSRAHLKTET
jgi:hypothetical protein